MVQELLQEVKEQLSKISYENIDEIIRDKYINLNTSYDMSPFVDVIGGYYHIKVCERRVVINDYKTLNKKLAAYIILDDYTYRQEYECLDDSYKYSCDAEDMIREIQSKYFNMFDDIYTKYFENDISIFKLDAAEEIE